MSKPVYYPIDSANFQRIRENEMVYVDKTSYIATLLKNKGVYFFLARPRRFGKSLFLDTLANYFSGKRELFKGLEIDKLQPEEWNKYPVLRFNMSGNGFQSTVDLKDHIDNQLNRIEKEYSVDNYEKSVSSRFNNLLIKIYEKTGERVVILIDEYDAPLSATIDNPELQEIYRDQLQGFYSVLKNREESIHFCMLTGVTRYGKVSVFSGLNNLNDITFNDDYAGVCGITKEELSKNYSEGIQRMALKEGLKIDETLELLKFHYDGYHFSPSLLDIYNPFSINYAFYNNRISDYWCRSGAPTILAKSLMQNDYDIATFTGLKVQEPELRDLSMYTENPIPLFYQTGYLTLKAYNPKTQRFTLGYPNREVEAGVLRNILNFYSPGKRDRQSLVFDLEEAFEEGNPEKVVKLLKSFLAEIPLDLRERVGRYENYYHTVFYCIVKLIGLDIQAEYATSEGYIDILVKTREYIYVIELKVNGTAKEAIKQINEKHYCEQFEADSRKLYKIGIGFSKNTGTIDTFEIEKR